MTDELNTCDVLRYAHQSVKGLSRKLIVIALANGLTLEDIKGEAICAVVAAMRDNPGKPGNYYRQAGYFKALNAIQRAAGLSRHRDTEARKWIRLNELEHEAPTSTPRYSDEEEGVFGRILTAVKNTGKRNAQKYANAYYNNIINEVTVTEAAEAEGLSPTAFSVRKTLIKRELIRMLGGSSSDKH